MINNYYKSEDAKRIEANQRFRNTLELYTTRMSQAKNKIINNNKDKNDKSSGSDKSINITINNSVNEKNSSDDYDKLLKKFKKQEKLLKELTDKLREHDKNVLDELKTPLDTSDIQ